MGISLGVIYGLIGMGMVLIFRSVGIVNFAQGDFLMLGAFASFALSKQLGLPIWTSLIITAVLIGLSGIVFQFVTYWPLRHAQDKAIVVSTLGASIALREMCKLIWGSTPQTIDTLKSGVIQIGPATLQWQYIVIIVLSVIIMASIYILLEKTILGNIMQATAQDQYAASLMGIPIVAAIAFTFAISILITGVGGVLLAPLFSITNTMGVNAGTKAFAAVVIGGFGSVPGAVIGGLIIGITEVFGGTFISTTYKDTIVFVVLIISLMARPNGLFGEKISEKA
jgi:Branched-chain amino acid ABC-type transport system, permease components